MISCQPELSFDVISIHREILEDREPTKRNDTILKRIMRAYEIIRTIIITVYGTEMTKFFPITMENFDANSTHTTDFSEVQVNIVDILDKLIHSNNTIEENHAGIKLFHIMTI
jgi:hypothetical protein